MMSVEIIICVVLSIALAIAVTGVVVWFIKREFSKTWDWLIANDVL